MSSPYEPKKYLKYEELRDLLENFAKTYPDLCELSSIGQSLEGRKMWVITLTDKTTAPHNEKPAYWVDGNTHAVELAGCQACVHLIYRCLENYGKDPVITRLLKEHTFYIVPRVSVDGAELSLTQPGTVRSNPVLWPYADTLPGLYAKDIDNNGFIGLMRRKNKNGFWKKSASDSRIMILRSCDDWDDEGSFYDVFTEGEIEGYDGFRIESRVRHGLDLNRQFPADWMPEGEQYGAGPFPLSQPESRALVQAITDRPNIVGLQSFHTFSSVILRPLANQPDEKMSHNDLQVYKAIGKRGKEITGYPDLSVFHDFKYHPKMNLGGGFFEWAYIHRGVFGFSNEIWHIAKKAGVEIKDDQHIPWLFGNVSEEDLLKVLSWCDQNLEAGSYFEEWKPFNHPQLGEVEIGGRKNKFTWNNPPPEYLEHELDINVDFVLSAAKCSPKVIVKSAESELVDREVRKLSLTLQNIGYLPTYGAERALKAGTARKPRVKLKLNGAVSIKQGHTDFEIEHLKGRVNVEPIQQNMVMLGLVQTSPSNFNETKLEWLISGTGSVEVEACFERGGTVRHIFD